MFTTSDHDAARSRHDDRLAAALAAFTARHAGRTRSPRAHCPLSLLAARILARRRPAAGGPLAA